MLPFRKKEKTIKEQKHACTEIYTFGYWFIKLYVSRLKYYWPRYTYNLS